MLGHTDEVEMSEQHPVAKTDVSAPGRTRIYFVDYLRGGLVSLVMLHHIAISYGGSGSFYYTVPPTDPLASLLLTLFTNFNQAWFLGAFFLISGYFTPGSFDRKGVRQFVKDRLIRLGIPFLVFFFVLNPITVYVAFLHTPAADLASQGITAPLGLNWTFYTEAVGNGPLWFVEMLLFFELGYVLWRVVTRRVVRSAADRPFPSYRKIAFFILTLAATSYLLWIVAPINAQILGFPSFFDLPQYLGFFVVGIGAARGGWLMKMPDFMAKRFLEIALLATVTLFLLSVIGTEDSSLGWGSLLGYGSLSSAFYALWSSTFAVGMTMFAISFFRRRFNSAGRFWQFAAKNFYGAYVLQAPVIVTITALVLYGVHLESLLMFCLASAIILPFAWGLAYLVRKIPHADEVL